MLRTTLRKGWQEYEHTTDIYMAVHNILRISVRLRNVQQNIAESSDEKGHMRSQFGWKSRSGKCFYTLRNTYGTAMSFYGYGKRLFTRIDSVQSFWLRQFAVFACYNRPRFRACNSSF